jgi:hypothetical protein
VHVYESSKCNKEIKEEQRMLEKEGKELNISNFLDTRITIHIDRGDQSHFFRLLVENSDMY